MRIDLCRLTGSGLLFLSSLITGLQAAGRLRKSRNQLAELCSGLELMRTELAYTAAPFPELCRRTGKASTEESQSFWEMIARQTGEEAADTAGLTRRAVRSAGLLLPADCLRELERLLDSFGCCDREGQLRRLDLTTERLRSRLEAISAEIEGKCRLRVLLGAAAGTALWVLVI